MWTKGLEQIHNYNEKVKAHCANKENVQFLEVASCVTDSKGYLTNTSDGLHLDSYQSWYNCIISEINGNSNNDANTPKGVEVYESGDGYNKKYTSSAGITYIQYKQNEGSYQYIQDGFLDPYYNLHGRDKVKMEKYKTSISLSKDIGAALPLFSLFSALQRRVAMSNFT